MTAKQWIDSDRNYQVGVEIYSREGNNPNLKRLFARMDSEYSRSKLLTELTGISNRQNPETISAPSAEITIDDFTRHTDPTKYPVLDYEKMPKEYQGLRIKKGKLYQQASYLHAQMESLQSDEQRLTQSLQILSCFKEIDVIWEKFDYWHKNGSVMPSKKGVSKTIDMDIASEVQLIQHRNRLRSVISKLKTKPKRATEIPEKEKQLQETIEKLKIKYGN